MALKPRGTGLRSTYECSRYYVLIGVIPVTVPKLTRIEMHIMEALWCQGPSSIREIQQAFPESDRPAYTTVQTTVYRLETKKALRRVKKISNAHIFEAAITRDVAQGRLIDEFLGLF